LDRRTQHRRKNKNPRKNGIASRNMKKLK